MFCPHCGQQLPDGAKFCTSCGTAVAVPETPPRPVYVPEPTPVPEPPQSSGPDPDQKPKKKSKKGLVIGLISAVVVLAALAAAFLLWFYPSVLSGSSKYETALEKAQTALSDEEYDDAVSLFTDALGYAPDDEARSLCYVGRGDAYMALEEYEDAIDDYEAALELDDNQKKVWGKLADAYLAAEDTDGAIAALEDGIDATGASSLETRLDELLQGGSSGQTTDRPAPESAPTADVSEITLGGVTFQTDAEEIILPSAGLYDISALAACTELRYLDLESNSITDLSPLRNCTKLETLYLNDNEISDISPLAGLTNLRFLNLTRNQISDLTPLQGLTQLVELWLMDNSISDTDALSGLYNLEILQLWNNPVRDISGLAGLTNLNYLDLDDTLVSDVSPLLGLTNLQTLYLSGDNLPDDAWDIIAEALPQFSGLSGPAPTAGSDVISIGTSPDYPPFEALMEDGTIYGFDIEYATSLFQDILGYNIGFAIYEFDDLLPALDAGEIDVVISAMAYTEERAAAFAVSDAYYTFPAGGSLDSLCIFLPYGDPRGLLPEINEVIAMLEMDGYTQALAECWGLEY